MNNKSRTIFNYYRRICSSCNEKQFNGFKLHQSPSRKTKLNLAIVMKNWDSKIDCCAYEFCEQQQQQQNKGKSNWIAKSCQIKQIVFFCVSMLVCSVGCRRINKWMAIKSHEKQFLCFSWKNFIKGWIKFEIVIFLNFSIVCFIVNRFPHC